MSKKVLSMVLGLTVVIGSFNVVFAADAVSGASNWTPETAAKPAAPKPAPSKPAPKPAPSKPAAKPVSKPAAKPAAPVVTKDGEIYVVQNGDMLWKIAARYNMTYQEIAKYNNLSNPNQIYVGQQLVIPTQVAKAEVKEEIKLVEIAEVAKPVEKPVAKPEVKPEVDAVSSASFPKEAAGLELALSEKGTWIICTTGDLVTDKEIVVDGEFRNKNKPEEAIYRKLALYDQDADKKVTAEHKLTAPKMTVKSENFKIQEGTFVGDIYVDAPGFTLTNTQVQGDIYFTQEKYRKTFKLEKEAKVSGALMIGSEIDAVSGASLAKDEVSLQNALDNKWIILFEEDMTTDKELVIDGRFERQDKKDLTKVTPTRKIALYEQDADKKVTAAYTLTAPKLTVKSTNTKIQEGTFVGDIYVEAPGFSLVNTKVDGNIYFAKEAYQRTADLSKGAVTGKVEVKQEAILDAVTTASFPVIEDTLHTALSDKGTWIICLEDDLKVEKEIVVDGAFRSKNDPAADIARKLALYAQDGGKNVTETYTLTMPKMTVKSENFKIQEGTVVGDIYVEANGFTLVNTKVDGNIYFANEEYKNSAKLGDGVTGTVK